MSGFASVANGATLERTIEVVQGLMRGKMNVVTSVTLAAGAATTTFTDSRIGGASFIGLTPTTANAKAEGIPYVTGKAKGSCVLNHANNAQVDRTYDVIVIG